MADYITIDGGTTNTRIALVQNGETTDVLSCHIGAKCAIDSGALLRKSIADGIRQLLERNGVSPCRITRVLASGMLTSELGLVNLPHICAPAGIARLHDSLYETVLDDIFPVPFVFVPGVKYRSDDFAEADMMRGEETELMGLFSGPGVYVLPGSHCKHITVDEDGQILSFRTMLTGEMIAALSQNTILKDAFSLTEEAPNEEYLLQGYHFCREHGLNQALFKVRTLKNLFAKDNAALYSFFIGCVLCPEITQLLQAAPERIVLGGRSQIKKAMAILLEKLSCAELSVVPDAEAAQATQRGAVRIYEYSRACAAPSRCGGVTM